MTTIYVLPTEEGLPPRAILSDGMILTPDGGVAAINPTAVTYSEEEETWVMDDPDDPDQGVAALPDDIAEVITEHARSLGVDL